MRFYFKLCLLLCLLAQNLVAQHRYLAWVDHQTTLRRKIDIDAGILLSEQANGTWLSEKNTGLSIESTCNLPTQIENNFFRINQGKDLLFTINGSQKVYQYTPATQILSRLDKTIHQGYNYHSSQFMRNDTLFSIGGYGFWQFNNIVTFFDKNLSEWSLVKTNGQKPSSIVDGFRGYDKEEEVFYTAGSMAVDSDYKNERTYSNEAYRLDFKTLTWEFLGTVNPKLPKQKGYEIVGTDFKAEFSHQTFSYKPKTAIVLGNEGKGIRPLVKKECDAFVYIPMKGHIQSLNVSVAAALLMYEVMR
jgi:hypothetical protein